MTRRDTLLAVLVAAIWGTNFVALKAGVADVPPLLFLTVRFLVLLLPAIFLVRRPAMPWRDLLLIGAFTCLGQFSLLYLALHLGMPPGLSSLVLQTQVLITIALGSLVLHEKPRRAQWAGVAVGGIGLGVIAVARGLTSPLLPLVVLVGAATCWSVGNLVTRRAQAPSGLGVTVWSGIVVPVPAFLLSLTFEEWPAITHAVTHWTWTATASTAYTAYLSSLVGYGIWNTLLSRHPVASVTPFAMLIPAFGILAAALAYHEVPTPFEAAGGLLLIAGVAVAVTRVRRRSGLVVPVKVEPAPGAPLEAARLAHRA